MKVDRVVVLTPEVEASLERVIEYLLQDEERHYQESPSANHIYLDLKTIKSWLKV